MDGLSPGDGAMTSVRKDQHIQINLEEDVQFRSLTTGLETLHLPHAGLPEINLADVDVTQILFRKRLSSPLLISSMTGGTAQGAEINRRLAIAAQTTGVALGLGSMRILIERPSVRWTFQVRDVARDILLLANLGAVQLNYGYTIRDCMRLVEMIGADGLVLHLNSVQEAVQPEGNTNFAGVLAKIRDVAKALAKEDVPVIVKEIGCGLSVETSRRLVDAGVAAIDVAGAGGTSWSEVEMHRAGTPSQRRIARAFREWGTSTAESIRSVRTTTSDLPVIASGGLRSGIDVAKCIALGATVGGMASPFLKAAVNSVDAVLQEIEDTVQELRIAMFCCGARCLARLRQLPLRCRRPDEPT